MSDLKPSGFANVGSIEDNRSIKSLQNTGNKVTMGVNSPRGSEGQVGDITVRQMPRLGYRIYIKTPSGWIDINSMTVSDTVEWKDMILPPTADNKWVRYHAANNMLPQYCRDSNGFVHFRGTMKGGSSTTVTDTITTLPPGFRPPKPVICALPNNGTWDGGQGSIQVTAAGVVNMPNGGDTDKQDLDGISFFAWQSPPATGGGQKGGHDPDQESGGGAPG